MPSDRRLHPSAILFGAGKHVKSLALPLVLAVIGAGRGSDVWTYVFAGVLGFIVLHGLLHYATFRYQLGDGELVIRSGILVRSERHVPYARIHNLDVSQHVVHRLFGVVEVRIQTGGGSEPEGVLRAIRAPDLDDLRARVRGQVPASTPAHRDLIAVPVRELVLAGLVELRGIALFAAGLGLVWELALSRVSGPGSARSAAAVRGRAARRRRGRRRSAARVCGLARRQWRSRARGAVARAASARRGGRAEDRARPARCDRSPRSRDHV